MQVVSMCSASGKRSKQSRCGSAVSPARGTLTIPIGSMKAADPCAILAIVIVVPVAPAEILIHVNDAVTRCWELFHIAQSQAEGRT